MLLELLERRRHQTGAWSRRVLARVTEQDIYMDAGIILAAVLHHNTLVLEDSSGGNLLRALCTVPGQSLVADTAKTVDLGGGIRDQN